MKTNEVAKMLGVAPRTARQWAKENNVQQGELVNSIWTYDWSDEDIERFKSRKTTRGRPKGYKKAK